MMRFFHFKNIFKFITKPYNDLKYFFGKTNTNLLIVILMLMFLILNVEDTITEKNVSKVEVNKMIADIYKFKYTSSIWSNDLNVDPIYIKNKIDNLKYNHAESKIVYNQKMDKMIYQNKKMTLDYVNFIKSEIKLIDCEFNYCNY